MIKNKEIILTVDIGSNAMRATFFKKDGKDYNVVLNRRFALRLGQDVFTTHKISPEKEHLLIHAFTDLWKLCHKYQIYKAIAVGTSALREAKNKIQILKKIYQMTGIKIKLISGSLEARIIFEAVKDIINIKKKNVAHIDVGGGSMEIIVSQKNKIKMVMSLPLGTVRLLQFQSLPTIQEKIEHVMKKNLKKYRFKEIDFLLGTGGNFKAILKVKNYLYPGSKKSEASYDQLKKTYQELIKIDFYQRIKIFDLKKDRADVIVPATYTVIQLMKNLKIDKLIVLDVGLEEGLLAYL